MPPALTLHSDDYYFFNILFLWDSGISLTLLCSRTELGHEREIISGELENGESHDDQGA